MPYRSWNTVFFPTPLIFRYHLPLNDAISWEDHKSIFSSFRISEMNLSNQSHFPGFSFSPERHLIGFCKSNNMALAIENKGPLCFLLLWWQRQLLGRHQHKRQLDAVVDVLAVVDILAVADVCWKSYNSCLSTGPGQFRLTTSRKLARSG